MKDQTIYKPKHDWKDIFDSKYYIAALCILGVIGFSATATMIYQNIHAIPAAHVAISTRTDILGITQNYGFNFNPSGTERTIISTFEQDPLYGTIYCVGPNGEKYEENEKYEVPINGPCLTATCTCGQQQQCTNNERTCCTADNDGTCKFGQTDCLYQQHICTCKNDGNYENCCPANDPCQCSGYCTDPKNGDKICSGDTYQKIYDNCRSFTCTCGGDCKQNQPTCCVGKNGVTCKFGADNCLEEINGIDYYCTCSNDGSSNYCYPAADPCQGSKYCVDINDDKICEGERYEIAGDACSTYECVCGSGDYCTRNTPTCCLDKDDETCAIGASGCKRMIVGKVYEC
eukprot:108047_1